MDVIEEGSRKAKSAYTIPINSTENGDMFTRLKQNHGQRDTLEVNGKSTLGRKVVSTPTFSDYEKKKQDTKMRRVMSLPNITSTEMELFMTTKLVAFPSISNRVNSFYRELEQQNLPSQPKVTFAFEDTYNCSLMFAVSQAIMSGSFLYGWNTSCLNVPHDIIKSDLGDISESEYSWLTSIFCLGAIIGSFFGGWFSERFGRKPYLLFNDVVWIIGGLLVFFVHDSFYILLTCRFLFGLAGGGACVVVPTYLGEISPTRVRGSIGVLNQFCICLGILVSEFIAKKGWLYSRWYIISAIPAVPAAMQLVTFWSFPESPAWLIKYGRMQEATMSLQWLRQHQEVDWEVQLLSRSIKGEDSSSGKFDHLNDPAEPLLVFNNSEQPEKKEDGLFAKMRNDVALKKGFIISCMMMIAQQLSGINSVFFYSGSVFKKAGVDVWLGTVLTGLANFLAVFAAIPLVDRLGRKLCFEISCSIMGVASVMATVGLYMGKESSDEFWQYFIIAALILFVTGFELGLGPIPWLIVAEVIPTSELSAIMGIASAINGIANFCVAQFFPVLQSSLDYLVYLPFLVVQIGSLIFVITYVVETKGKRVEEVQLELRGKKNN